jgi:hypothetical protein
MTRAEKLMKRMNGRALGLACLIILAAIATTLSGSKQNVRAAKQQGPGEPPVSAQGQSRQSDVRDLTIRLAGLNARYQLGGKGERASLLEELSNVAAMRRQILSELMESDPAEVLRVALPEGFGANMPAEVRENLEQRVDLTGKLEVLYACGEAESHLSHFLNADGRRLSLHFAGGLPGDLLTDSQVRVQGVELGDGLALDSTSLTSSTVTTQSSSVSVAPNTFGEQKVLILLVNFQDKMTQPWTTDQVRSLVFGTVSNFYMESSYQQTWLTGDVFGWYTLPISSSTCDTSAIQTYAEQAATAAGVNLSAYNRRVFAYPSLSACSFTGASTVGGNPSLSWINGSMVLRTVGHELEHGLGLYHARALDCGADVIGSTCSYTEYGDSIEILGQAGLTGHSHAAQKERLGWLNYGTSPGITSVQASGTYWLDPYETAGTNPKALKVLKSIDSTTGVQTSYYIEFRRPVGFDSFISSNSNVMNGVMVHTSVNPYGRDNYLLDMTPSTSSFSDAALDVGHSYNDPNTNVTISPVSVSSSGASVNVTFGPQPCVQANPSMNLSPSATQWFSPGATVTYQVSVTNNDSGCPSSSFALQAAVPSGWSAAFDNSTVAITAGGSATVMLTVTSPSSATDGFYNVGVTAVNSAAPNYSASGSVTCAIMSGLAVSIASDQASYTRSQTATITAMVTAAGAPVSGASVSFTLTKPNGTKATGTATTGANGSAVFKYRFNKQRDPVGTYQVSANANMNGVTGTAVTSFSVK